MEGEGEGEGDCSYNSFISAMTLTKMRVPHVPQRYVLPPSQRPNPTLDLTATLPIVDLSSLHHASQRSLTLDKIQIACKELGFFQHKIGCVQKELEEGNQLMAINCYPACPEPDITLGMPPHSDYGTLTILLQSGPGLQLRDNKKNWLSVPLVEGALIVQLGDQIEVMSNGQYKSVVHQVTLSAENKRLSIVSLHSLPLNKKVGPAPELVDEQHPVSHISNGSNSPPISLWFPRSSLFSPFSATLFLSLRRKYC